VALSLEFISKKMLDQRNAVGLDVGGSLSILHSSIGSNPRWWASVDSTRTLYSLT